MPVFARLFKERHARRSCMPRPRLPRALAFRRPGRAGKRPAGAGRPQSGWLNRAIGALPKGDRVAARGGLAVGVDARSSCAAVPVLGWAPQLPGAAADDLAARVIDLYAHRDPILQMALAEGLETDRMAAREGMAGTGRAAGPAAACGWRPRARQLMAADDGPRIARSPSTAGTPTPTKAAPPAAWPTPRRARRRLRGVREGPGPSAGRTRSFVAITEFGRTAAHQRHERHRPWHRHGRVACRRSREGRPGHRRLAGPRANSSTNGATSSRPPICGRSSRACWPSSSTVGRCTGRCSVSAIGRREADDGLHRLIHHPAGRLFTAERGSTSRSSGELRLVLRCLPSKNTLPTLIICRTEPSQLICTSVNCSGLHSSS